MLSHILTVSELTAQIRIVLEDAYPAVWVEGQISNLHRASSGHQYFTLKDQKSQIRVVLFRGVAQQVPFALQEGLEVVVRGRVTVYESRGDYQLILESVEPKGIGALHLAFEQLKRKLEREGIFDLSRKRSIPSFPSKIGVITSRHGAALHDVLSILQRRCPVVPILIHPVLVQGNGAGKQIQEAIRMMNTMKDVDVLIVGRGGGSLEDLWSFNEEHVVRAIAGSRIPVISAVGHETDVTLADLAADVRAPTPSAAAEMVVPPLEDLRIHVKQLRERLGRVMQISLERCRHGIERVQASCPDPALWLYRLRHQVDDLELRLHLKIKEFHEGLRVLLLSHEARVLASTPEHHIRARQQLVPQLVARMLRGINSFIKEKRHRSHSNGALLHNLSPLAILSRGYCIIETKNREKVVRTIDAVNVGELLNARLADGQLTCIVESVKRNN